MQTERVTNMVTRHGYIDKFDTAEEIRECAKYYIEILGLQDWKFKFVLDTPSDLDNMGECEQNSVEKCACITLDNREHPDLWFRQPHEMVLVHELLHCKIPLPSNEHWDGAIVDLFYHQLIDDMAKAVFFARYGLTNKDLYFDESDENNGREK